MAIEIKGKIYRNLQEQVEENLDDITEIKENLLTDEAAIASLQTGKANVADVYDKTTIDGVVEGLEEDIAAKVSLSDLATVATTGSYNDLTNKPDLSVYELAADAFSGDYNDLTNKPSIPSSTDFVTITGIQTITGVKKFESTDGSVYIYPSGFINIAKSATGRGVTVKPDMLECSGASGSTPSDFKITNYYSGGSSTYTFDRTKSGTVATTNETFIKDSNGNINEIIHVGNISSKDGEDSDNKATIVLNSGVSSSNLTLEAGGEESSALIYLRGTTSVGSEGSIVLNGQTSFITENRITVTDGNNNRESIAYLSDIPTAVNLYQHKYKFNYADSVDGVYFKFEVEFISTRSTVYTTIADIFTYLLAHNNDGDIVGRTYGYEITLPTDWAFGGEIEADTTMNALQFTVRDDTYQPVTYAIYSNTSGFSLIASSCYLIN